MSRVPPTVQPHDVKIGVAMVGISNSQRRRMRVTRKGEIVRAAPDVTGLKNLIVRFGDQDYVTPYGRKELARRRAARKVAHESRRRNR
jgi:hypothetical protein